MIGRWIPVTATGSPRVVLDAAVPPGAVAIVDGGDRPAAYGWLAHPDDAASELAAAASAVAARAAVHAAVTVLGAGALAELVRLALPPAAAGPPDAVVVAGGDLIADAVERVRDRGTVLLAVPAPDPLVRTYADVHRRGLTVTGVPWLPAPDPPRRLVDWAAAHAVTVRSGRPANPGAWYRLEPS